jgi:hypothetical protein
MLAKNNFNVILTIFLDLQRLSTNSYKHFFFATKDDSVLISSNSSSTRQYHWFQKTICVFNCKQNTRPLPSGPATSGTINGKLAIKI